MADQPGFPAAALSDAYGIGPLTDAVLLPAGKSLHWRVSSPLGRWVARCSYRSKTPAHMELEHALMRHLLAGGLPVPQVAVTAAGRTWAEIEGRLWRLTRFVAAESFRNGHLPHVDALGHALARYHDRVRSFRPPAAPPAPPPLWESVAARLVEVPAPGQGSPGLDHLLASAAGVADALRDLDAELPRTVVHGGCRRGSTLFTGDRLTALLDFDSARFDARVADLAVAVHDLTKVYGDPGDADHKVPLDLDLAARFLAAYQRAGGELTAPEIRALPLLLAAKRCKRALGRYRRLVAGEPVSDGDRRKIALEVARVRWLDDHRDELESVLSGLAPTS